MINYTDYGNDTITTVRSWQSVSFVMENDYKQLFSHLGEKSEFTKIEI